MQVARDGGARAANNEILLPEVGEIPQPRFVATREVESLRNRNTRVWENVYEVPLRDPRTGEPTSATRTESQRYTEKATNLCYEAFIDGATRWLPASPDFEPLAGPSASFENREGSARVALSRRFNDPYHVTCRVGETDLRFGLIGLGLYERRTGRLVQLREAMPVEPFLAEPNRLQYPNAFPGADVEYVRTLSAFTQLVKLQGLGSLTPPESYGMDPSDTYVVVLSRLNLHEEGLDVVDRGFVVESVSEGDQTNLGIVKDGERLCELAPGFAWDEGTEPEMGHPVYKRLVRTPAETTLIEGVPYRWLASGDRTFPVTIDYVIRTGNQGGDEVWKSGETYHVSNEWLVGSGNTLVVEPGAILKLGSGANCRVNGDLGRIRACGTRFRYIVATSWNDNTVGATISGSSGSPAVDDYASVFRYSDTSAADPVEYGYLKIRYATDGIVQGNEVFVHDCIFEQNTRALGVFNNAANKLIANNLFHNNAYSGINVVNWGTNISLRIENNTFHDNLVGLVYSATGVLSTLDGANNILTGDGAGIHAPGSWTVTNNLTNTAYQSGMLFFGQTPPANEYHPLDDLPYDPNPNGLYYLSWQEDGETCRAFAIDPQYLDPRTVATLTGKTVDAPIVVEANITSPEYWYKRPVDWAKTSIGFHYDRVDYVLGSDSGNDLEVKDALSISPGCVIAFWRDDATTDTTLNLLDSSVNLQTGDPVVFTSLYATSDRVRAPGPGDYVGIQSDAAVLSNAVIRYADLGFRLIAPQSCALRNVVFEHCNAGASLVTYPNGGEITVQNGLFTHCNTGLIGATANNVPGRILAEYCTFDRCGTAAEVLSYVGDATIAIRESIVSNCGIGIAANTGNMPTVYAEASNNVFWNVIHETEGDFYAPPTITGTLNANPKYAHQLPRLTGEDELLLHQTGDAIPDGYYLSQNAGDRSTRPLRAKHVAAVDVSGWSSPASPASVYIYGWDSLSDPAPQLKYEKRIGWGGQDVTPTGTKTQDLYLEIGSGSNYVFDADDVITLTLDSGAVIDVHMPLGTYVNSSGFISMWIAEDGSTYWARRNSPVYSAPKYVQRDALYAMRYAGFDEEEYLGLAGSANQTDPEADPPPLTNDDSIAVDAGASEYHSDGITSVLENPDDAPLDLGYHYGISNYNDLAKPVARVRFAYPLQEGKESSNPYNVAVIREDGSHLDITLEYETVADTAGSGVDFQYMKSNLIMGPKQGMKRIPVNILPDAVADEPAEYFYLALKSLSPNVHLDGSLLPGSQDRIFTTIEIRGEGVNAPTPTPVAGWYPDPPMTADASVVQDPATAVAGNGLVFLTLGGINDTDTYKYSREQFQEGSQPNLVDWYFSGAPTPSIPVKSEGVYGGPLPIPFSQLATASSAGAYTIVVSDNPQGRSTDAADITKQLTLNVVTPTATMTPPPSPTPTPTPSTPTCGSTGMLVKLGGVGHGLSVHRELSTVDGGLLHTGVGGSLNPLLLTLTDIDCSGTTCSKILDGADVSVSSPLWTPTPMDRCWLDPSSIAQHMFNVSLGTQATPGVYPLTIVIDDTPVPAGLSCDPPSAPFCSAFDDGEVTLNASICLMDVNVSIVNPGLTRVDSGIGADHPLGIAYEILPEDAHFHWEPTSILTPYLRIAQTGDRWRYWRLKDATWRARTIEWDGYFSGGLRVVPGENLAVQIVFAVDDKGADDAYPNQLLDFYKVMTFNESIAIPVVRSVNVDLDNLPSSGVSKADAAEQVNEDEVLEEQYPGRLIYLNRDDDNLTGDQDYDDDAGERRMNPTLQEPYDDDLKKFRYRIENYDDLTEGTVELRVASGEENTNVWQKYSEIEGGETVWKLRQIDDFPYSLPLPLQVEIDYLYVEGCRLGSTEYELVYIPADNSPERRDANKFAVFDVVYTPPEIIPHRDSQVPEEPIPMGSRVRIEGGSGGGTPEEISYWVYGHELTIWDPYQQPTATNSESWTPTPAPERDVLSVLDTEWDGEFGANNEHHVRASDVFMKASITTRNNDDSAETTEAKENKIAIRVTQGGADVLNADVEVRDDFTASIVSNELVIPGCVCDPPGSGCDCEGWTYEWNFGPGAMRPNPTATPAATPGPSPTPPVLYTDAHVLRPNDLRESVVTGKYITGQKCALPDTDMGLREIEVSVTSPHADPLLRADYGVEPMIHEVENHHGKITFYYVPYEANEGFDGDLVETTINNGGNLYLCRDFRGDAWTQGTGRLHRVRLNGNGDKESGQLVEEVVPPHSLYIKTDGGTYDEPQFILVNQITGGFDTPLNHQDAARYVRGTRANRTALSLFNHAAYMVDGLMNHVNNTDFPQQNDGEPMDLDDNQVDINDSGVFDGIDVVDEKHLDVYLEPAAGANDGIDPRNMQALVHDDEGNPVNEMWFEIRTANP